jgi:hypothetical protein
VLVGANFTSLTYSTGTIPFTFTTITATIHTSQLRLQATTELKLKRGGVTVEEFLPPKANPNRVIIARSDTDSAYKCDVFAID